MDESPTCTSCLLSLESLRSVALALEPPDAVENGGGSTDGELLERLSFGAGSSTRG